MRNLTIFVAFVAVVAIICGYAYSVYGKLTHLFDNINPVVLTLDQLCHFILTASNLMSVFSIVRVNEFQNLITAITDDIQRVNRWSIALSMLVVLLLITDALLLLRLAGWPHFKYYVAKDVQFYFFNVTLITVINLGSAVVDQFKNINESLALMASRWYDRGTITLTVRKERIGYKPDSFPAELRRLQQYHNRLCDLIDKFNEVMGSVLLLAILYIVTSLLWDVSAVIEFFVKGCVIEGVRLDDLVLLDFLFWILISIGQTMFMARVGNAVVDENKRTLNYCYEFMNKLPSIPDTLVQRIRDNLRELANQVEARRPALTAAGIVKIDFRILGIVTTNTVTYVVVVLQFLFKQ